ncbi:PmeII family type II restriction endonuclease [Providencia stuartii]|uniref:PmeII family type II restriction endonuclease n=1 Tax=Providencia TaxID=586 RepID=UPI0011230C98|nr:PmeII family type II restriction endonuclease [Providencia stuartii]
MSSKEVILAKVKEWFSESIAKNHIKNTEKLVNPNEFNINPFLAVYLAKYLTGNASPESIAKALVLPRVLSTSITTSFGQHMQSFLSIIKETYGSTTAGVDIEFIDCIDGNKKYCQLKAGPNTINKDDVESIAGHFTGVRNLARTNNVRIHRDDMIVGVLYGDSSELSSHYKRITSQYEYPVIIGQDFWLRLTGDEDFYADLIKAITSVAIEADYSQELNKVITELAKTDKIQQLSSL